MLLRAHARFLPGAVHRIVLAVVLAIVMAASCLATSVTVAQARPGTAPATVSGGGWGAAREVPGLAVLDKGRQALIYSVSCASAGNCSAGGFYGAGHAFVVDQSNGRWGTAKQIRGAGITEIYSVSCAAPGDCSAGGLSSLGQVVVVDERNGTWGKAEQVRGIASLNTGKEPYLYSVSCASPGNCAAGGYYTDSSAHQQGFVVDERNGIWGTAQEVPGTAALNQGGLAFVYSVSCASAGNCSAGGFYEDGSLNQQAFVVSERSGAWGAAQEVPGTAALNTDGYAAITAVSCTSAGNCSAGGYYSNVILATSAFVVNEANGTWGTAHKVPHTEFGNRAGGGGFTPISCTSAGNCGTGGIYQDSSGNYHAFVLSRTNGTWGAAQEVRSTTGGGIYTLSCASAGNCSAGGDYATSRRHHQAFVVDETNGTWGSAQEVPGMAILNKGGSANVNWMSCASPAHCSAVGDYLDGRGQYQAFVVTRT